LIAANLPLPEAPHPPFTTLYFSMVTFSTLGFGDVTPCNWVGEPARISHQVWA